jgi:hypothetical protein
MRVPQLSNRKFDLEGVHDYDPGKVPNGNAHGSGRVGAGIREWGKRAKSEF